ncbi:DUF6537 domain-containing protein [Actinosynnema sp. NPDC023587]|uniref:DUF6537 domain-containing protein n=1 Tax=Actinosynnema sp. NPDC023587 TaxID=3154695 RepID=UPI0033E2DDAD
MATRSPRPSLTAERSTVRALVQAAVVRAFRESDVDRAAVAELAALPDMVRGYEEVKLANVRQYRERQQKILARLADVPVPSA